MKYLSICSGIEAATVAWHPLGWQPIAFSEIEPFPSAVLAHHWPDVPNLGDMTKHNEWRTIRPNLIVGGTPCQAFSVAGLRKGLEDPRGNLTLTFLAIVAQHRPAWVVWENVPGVLSDRTGAFGSFLGGLAELGYGWAYRVLDAQYFGVAQRRRRVFVVASLGGWGRAGAVLFERESLLWHPAPSRKAGKGTAADAKTSLEPIFLDRATFNQGENAQYDPVIRQDGVSDALVARGPHAVAGFECGPSGSGFTEIAPTLDTRCKDGPIRNQLGAGVFHGFRMAAFGEYEEDQTASCMKQRDYKDATDLVTHCIAENIIGRQDHNGGNGQGHQEELSYTLNTVAAPAVATPYAVRRLTPTECERLQGFPDGHTAIPWRNKTADQCPDGPRYKALGNSMAVPVMRWIGERINYVDTL